MAWNSDFCEYVWLGNSGMHTPSALLEAWAINLKLYLNCSIRLSYGECCVTRIVTRNWMQAFRQTQFLYNQRHDSGRQEDYAKVLRCDNNMFLNIMGCHMTVTIINFKKRNVIKPPKSNKNTTWRVKKFPFQNEIKLLGSISTYWVVIIALSYTLDRHQEWNVI